MKKFVLFVLCCVSCVAFVNGRGIEKVIEVKCPDCNKTIKVTVNVECDNDSISKNVNTELTETSSNQCKAITAKGTQCSRKAQDGSNYCWQHTNTSTAKITTTSSTTRSSYSGQCMATTKAGRRCSRSARSNGYCWQHGG